MDELDQKFNEYYESQSLSSEKLHEILRRGRYARMTRRFRSFKLVAMFMIGIGIIIGIAISTFSSSDITPRVIQEVAMNHGKNLDVEIEATSLQELVIVMTKLDFSLDSQLPSISQEYELIGGRYCSIQANIAAQLKIAEIETGDNGRGHRGDGRGLGCQWRGGYRYGP